MNDSPTNAPDAVDRVLRLAQLLDFYGPLLTDRQRQFLELHFEGDLSFGEIAREFGVSRQAVHDAVKHAETALEQYEAKLGFSKRGVRPRDEDASQPAQAPAPAPASQIQPPIAPAPPIAGLDAEIAELRRIVDHLRRAGGVLYNTDGIARDLQKVADRLRDLDPGQ